MPDDFANTALNPEGQAAVRHARMFNGGASTLPATTYSHITDRPMLEFAILSAVVSAGKGSNGPRTQSRPQTRPLLWEKGLGIFAGEASSNS
jgi:hypothetical protein